MHKFKKQQPTAKMCDFYFDISHQQQSNSNFQITITDTFHCITAVQINQQAAVGVTSPFSTLVACQPNAKLTVLVTIQGMYNASYTYAVNGAQGTKQAKVQFQVMVDQKNWGLLASDNLQAALSAQSIPLLVFALAHAQGNANQLFSSLSYCPNKQARDPTFYQLTNAMPIHYAALNWPDAIPILMAHGAVIDAPCDYSYTCKCQTYQMTGVTALQLATFHKCSNAVQLLTQHGASQAVTCTVNWSASYYMEDDEDPGEHYNQVHANVTLATLATLCK